MRHNLLTLALAASGVLAGIFGGAHAGEPRDAAATFVFGAVTLHALPDAHQRGNASMLEDAPAGVVGKLLPDGLFPLDINAFVLRVAEQVILVDTGNGVNRGRALQRLADVGLAPADIDVVLLTHFHGDHIGGLTDRDGNLVFPKARILVPDVERTYWLDDNMENEDGIFINAREKLLPYGDRLRSFSAGDEVCPGIEAVALHGHTPGHTGFLVDCGDAGKLLIWGDLMHCAPVQFPHPEVNMSFDQDRPQAAATRRAALRRIADEGWSVAGMHLPFPGVGAVKAEGEGFSFTPAAPSPAPVAFSLPEGGDERFSLF